MAQLGEVGAKTEDKKNKDETSQVEMELFLSVIFDGCVNCQVQKAQHDAYRNSQSLNIDTSQEPTLSFSGNDNTNIAPSPNAMVENDLIKHETIIIDMSTGSGYADRVSRIRQQIERSAQQYYEKPNVKKLTVHLYLFFYRQCDPAVNLLGDLAPTDEGDAKKKIKQLFAKKLFDNKKVKYQGIEYIGSFDPADEDFSRKVDNGDPTDMNAPTNKMYWMPLFCVSSPTARRRPMTDLSLSRSLALLNRCSERIKKKSIPTKRRLPMTWAKKSDGSSCQRLMCLALPAKIKVSS